jgi:hypothetical protein
MTNDTVGLAFFRKIYYTYGRGVIFISGEELVFAKETTV